MRLNAVVEESGKFISFENKFNCYCGFKIQINISAELINKPLVYIKVLLLECRAYLYKQTKIVCRCTYVNVNTILGFFQPFQLYVQMDQILIN